MKNWQVIGRVLEEMRRQEVSVAQAATVLPRPEDAFASAQFLSRPSDTSGLLRSSTRLLPKHGDERDPGVRDGCGIIAKIKIRVAVSSAASLCRGALSHGSRMTGL